jgi:PAS domain S-box-containing protein
MLLGIDATIERSQVQKQEAILQSISNTGITAELDINGNLLEWNPKFADLFHLSQKELKSMVIFDLIHPIELDSFNKRWDGLIHGTPFDGIVRAKNPKGEEYWITCSFNIAENAAHEIERVVFAGYDITHEKSIESELQRAAETLKKQEKQIRDAEKEQGNKLRELKSEMMTQFREVEKARNLHEKMLEEMADAVIITGHDNRITTFNKSAEKLWDITRDHVLGQDISILFPESVVEKDEILASFVHPGNHKITGNRKKTTILDKKGKQKQVYVLLTKARADNENAYMAFFQNV